MSEWRDTSLGDVLTLQRGFDITKATQREGAIPVVSSSGINSYHDKAMVDGPGVVIGRKGTLGTCFFIDKPFWPHDTTLWIKDFKGNWPRFCYYLLKRLDLAKYDVGAANPTLNRNHIHLLPVQCPSLPAQQRIASVLGAYDDLIEVNRRRIAVLEEMARRLFEEWFVHFRFPGHERHATIEMDNGPLPEGWKVQAFTDVADVLSGGTPRKDRSQFWGGDIPFFTPRDAPLNAWALRTDAAITEEGLNSCNSRLYEKDTIFITARGTVGKIALAGCSMAMNQSCYALRGRGLPQFFLLELTRSAIDQLRAMSNGAVFDTIIVDTFRKLRVVVPPVELTKQYDTQIGPLLELSRILLIANERLAASRDMLLPRLLSGEVSVSKAERELEAVA